ncbi:nucleoid occlusion protein [Anaerorhabdus furcosa]|uniref:Chromosome partitioning protein, ParB family n=1 Tax=Anaerorhabdus furcosa TaxID=118967 RepID=A0A1T4MTR0_9FIRM|nr:nucleoid occlusion protein [Anaerorhabdus furcosa]SJZ70500.1 chromosome partitioning protein, ParB family [Anaerorhabdus furcosa]
MKEILNIEVNRIRPNRYQPRLEFDQVALEELAQSIKENGLIQPITVREYNDTYEIIAGERRFRACQLAGFDRVPCYIMTPTEEQAAQMALVENVQRENLTAIEEARAYVQIMRQASLTQEEVARKIGKTQSTVANKIRLLNLPEEIRDGIIQRQITERHARALLSLSGDKQIEAYHNIVDRQYNVRQAEGYIEELKEDKPKKKKQSTKGFTRNTQIGINSVNQCIQMIKKTGIDVTSEIDETLTDVRVIIKFPK